MAGIETKGAMFRGSGLAPTTQDWAAGLRGSSAAARTKPTRRSGNSTHKMSMLTLASQAREWRREQKRGVQKLFLRWRKRARRGRLHRSSPPPSGRRQFEFRVRVGALQVVRAFLHWRHEAITEGTLREMVELLRPHMERRREVRQARFLLARWQATSRRAATTMREVALRRWRAAALARHGRQTALLASTQAIVRRRASAAAAFWPRVRREHAWRQWAARHVSTALLRGACSLGELGGAARSWRWAIGQWRWAAARAAEAEQGMRLAQHTCRLLGLCRGLRQLLRALAATRFTQRRRNRAACVCEARARRRAWRRLRNRGGQAHTMRRADRHAASADARLVRLALCTWQRRWRHADGGDLVSQYACFLARRLPRAPCASMGDVLRLVPRLPPRLGWVAHDALPDAEDHP